MTAGIRAWLHRLWGTFRKAPADPDMQAELQAHVEMLADDLERRGLPRENALRQARLQLGGIAQAMEHRRDQRGLPWLEDLVQDLRFAARTLRRSPGFTAVALITLALAIGANTAIFSIVDPLLFRDLSVRDPASLVQFTWQYPGDPPLNLFSVQNYEAYRDHGSAFSELMGLAVLSPDARVQGERGGGEVVTGNFLEALGVRPAAGRILSSSDDRPGAPAAAVISWRYWRARYNLDQRVLDGSIEVEDPRLPAPMHATVVGVAARDFTGVIVGDEPDVWLSFASLPAAARSRPGLSLLARLKPGISIDQAQAEMRVLDRDRIEGFAARDPQWRQVAIDVKPARAGLSTPLQDQFGGPLRVVLALVGILLLLACANIGGLLLARGSARRHEMAIRVSLGAGRFRLVRQGLTESLLLAAIGSATGLVVARAAAGPLLRMVVAGTRSLGPVPMIEVALDGRVLLFTVLVATAAALLFGMVPAWAAFVSAPVQALRTGRGQQGSSWRLGRGLVAAQIALSLALVSVSQLYVSHLSRLRDRSLGFDPAGVLLVSVTTARPGVSREQQAALLAAALDRLRALHGVENATMSGMTPTSGAAGSRFVRAEGFDEPAQARRRVSLNTIGPTYFDTYRTPILAGRPFRDADGPARRVIINQALARHYFAGRDPVGLRLWFDNDRDPVEIVGVVADAKYQDVRIAAPPTAYVPFVSSGGADVSVRTTGAPEAMAADVRRVLEEALGAASVQRATTLAEQVDASIVPERLLATLSGFFGGVGVLLAAIGLYGLLSYVVTRRTHEIGIRMALGATRDDVMRMVLKSALWLAIAGCAAGAPVAIWGERIAAGMLEHLPPGGPWPVPAAAAAMVAVALVAAYVPARRATRIEPLTALRVE
jgi:predicted permease